MSFLMPTAVRPALGMCGTYLAVGSSNADKALSGITQVIELVCNRASLTICEIFWPKSFLCSLAFDPPANSFCKSPSMVKILEKLCLTVCVYTGNCLGFFFTRVLMTSFVCNFCLFSQQQQINSMSKYQNSAGFNLSRSTFYMCPDKSASALSLHWEWEASDGLFMFYQPNIPI